MRRKVTFTDKLMRPIAHFSHAVRVGEMIYVGATAGTDQTRQLVGSRVGYVDAMAQTRQMLDNLATVLGLLGGKLSDVVKVKTYLTDPRDIAGAREISVGRVGRESVQAFVGSHAFPLPQAAVELDAIAILDGEPREGVSLSGGDEALRVGKRVYATVTSRGDNSSGLATQVAVAFANLAELLSELALGLSDLVHLHVTVSHVAEAAVFRSQAGKTLGDAAVALTVLVAPLPDPSLRFQIEAYALIGGGRWIAAGRNAVMAGDELYFGAQLGRASDGGFLHGAEPQVDAAWNGIEAMLRSVNVSPHGVLRTNNILTDWRDYAAFNRGYGKHVDRPYPPRTTVLATLEYPEARTQIEGIAYCGSEEAAIVDVRPEE
jgi:enamine deaminase RidA (YjgF/YER057c/UK114 family)